MRIMHIAHQAHGSPPARSIGEYQGDMITSAKKKESRFGAARGQANRHADSHAAQNAVDVCGIPPIRLTTPATKTCRRGPGDANGWGTKMVLNQRVMTQV